MAESTGRVLATRLYELTDDSGMKNMPSFLIARDTMHQNQWLAVLEELGGPTNVLPIPNSFSQSKEVQDLVMILCLLISIRLYHRPIAVGPKKRLLMENVLSPWCQLNTVGAGVRLLRDKECTFSMVPAQPSGQAAVLGTPSPEGYAQKEQMTCTPTENITPYKIKDIL